MEYAGFGKVNKKNIMQEIKEVQFNIQNNTEQSLSINLFDSSAITNQNVSASSVGSIDTSFVYGAGFSGGAFPTVDSIAIQTNGKIVVGGLFTDYN